MSQSRHVGPFSALERWAGLPIGWWLVAGWAMAEALVFPIVPDVLACLLVLAAPRRVVVLFLAVVVGALAGSSILYAIAVARPDIATAMVLAVPGVRPEMLAEAVALMATGDPTAFVAFGPGTPLKVDTVAWAMGSGGPVGLAMGVVLNRLTRVGPVLLVAAAIGLVAPNALRRWSWRAIGLYAALWLVFYAVFLGLVPVR
jgi:1-acyl-sn-glycerol-3-phosphate acyltransferase